MSGQERSIEYSGSQLYKCVRANSDVDFLDTEADAGFEKSGLRLERCGTRRVRCKRAGPVWDAEPRNKRARSYSKVVKNLAKNTEGKSRWKQTRTPFVLKRWLCGFKIVPYHLVAHTARARNVLLHQPTRALHRFKCSRNNSIRATAIIHANSRDFFQGH